MGENLVALSLLVSVMSTFIYSTPSAVLFIANQSGGAAGTVTDLVFYPIDTIRTRLQAKGGFFKNGGWSGIYKGVASPIIASAPGGKKVGE
jgi:hypothetical protein